MANDGYDPMGSCFIFDYDPTELGLNVVHDADGPARTTFTEEDEKWLKAMRVKD